MFLPTTRQEMDALGWDKLDIILITGDSYIDSPFIGVALVGRVLYHAGFRVGIIGQPDTRSAGDISRLGEPALFWGVTGGSVDSMIANYTSQNKKRRSDDYTPGGVNNRRPDRASIVYTNLIRQYFKRTKLIVLGGIEASLRRIAHYDYWSDRVRGSLLFDSKADLLLYGMAEKGIVELARLLKAGASVRHLRGLCYIAAGNAMEDVRQSHQELPSFETVSRDKGAFAAMFHAFYNNNDPLTAGGLYQKHGSRYLVHNPPPPYETQAELDGAYGMDFERAQHPYYQKLGKAIALETIRFSIATHRGCYGECNFCAIAVHEGRTVRWRSVDSVVTETRLLSKYPDFKGYILDLEGPTSNMYGFECARKLKAGACPDRRCLYPEVCPSLKPDHSRQLELLRRVKQVPGVKKVFIASGVRYDLLLADRQHGMEYLEEVVEDHVSGQLKVAPEHTERAVLKAMGKPGPESLMKFKKKFDEMSRNAGREQFLTYYLIAAHPGCSENDMRKLKSFAGKELKINPRQVQIFVPTPSTYSSLMYYTGIDPFSGQEIFVERGLRGKQKQKEIVAPTHSRRDALRRVR
ncbi:MAG: YgiQ family radical SAM protein [Chloroflexi bacterium]|nr:YgiQ family radical SAM protein [Chloroflexota bacterium]